MLLFVYSPVVPVIFRRRRHATYATPSLPSRGRLVAEAVAAFVTASCHAILPFRKRRFIILLPRLSAAAGFSSFAFHLLLMMSRHCRI